MLSALAASLVIGMGSPATWVWQSFPADRFKILAPVTLVLEEKLAPGIDGPVDYHQYHGGMLSDSALAMAFVIDHYLLPQTSDARDPSFADTLLKETIDALIHALGGELVYWESMSHGRYEACAWKAIFQDGRGVIRGKSVLAGRRYYGLQAFGLAANKPEESMNKFLDSFQLLDAGP